MRVKHGIEAALSRLADFMNVVHSALNKDQWEQWRTDERAKFERKRRKEDVSMPLPLEVSVEEAQAIRGELHQVLWALCAGPRHLPEGLANDLMDRLRIPASTLIGVILSKLQALPFDAVSRRVDSGGVLIRRGGKKERWAVEFIPASMDARTTLYYLLARAFEFEAISALKICPSSACRKYFVTKDPRQHFCNPYCRFTFNNHQKTARKNKRKATQKTKHEEVLQKAKRLLDEGKSFKVLKAETGLSDRTIEKLFEER